MESALRKTVIKLQSGVELHFLKLIKFTKFGCKALFSDPDNKTIYDVNTLSRSLIQLNNFSQQLKTNLLQFQRLKSNSFCQITSITQDEDIIYIISQVQKQNLLDLIKKRQGLTQFQIIYFILDLIQIINFLKDRNIFYQIIQFDQVYLNKNIKLIFCFSIWTSVLKYQKSSTFRIQNHKDCIPPEFFLKNYKINIQQICAWNIGIFIYKLSQGVKPFIGNSQLVFTKKTTPLVRNLVQSLLKRDPQQRIKFPLILVHGLFKKYPSLPHILPQTIFSCPPSNQYISQYCKNFQQRNHEWDSCTNKILNIRTAYYIQQQKNQSIEKPRIKSFKSFKYLKPSVRNMVQTKSYITQYVDISQSYGFGYQMSTGLICFVFNDQSQIYFDSSMKKQVTYITRKKLSNTYSYEKLPQQSELKKKLYVLQAYTKSIKKYKHSNQPSNKPIMVSQYYKTNSAAVFLLTNQTIQIIFNDKIIFILTKHSLKVQNKNYDKFQNYQSLIQNDQLITRKNYSLILAQKLFHWDISYLKDIKTRRTSIQLTFK